MTEFREPVFYIPGTTTIIDNVVDRNGVLVGHYSGETLEQIRLRYPAPPSANGSTCMQKPKPLAKQNLLKSRKTSF